MYLLGLDIGSSSVKASLIDAATGKCAASDFMPKVEQPITAVKAGWAEQDPEMWYTNMKAALANVMKTAGVAPKDVQAVGISYQMHGLVLVDKNQHVLRPAIIWCDSRAVPYGEKAFTDLGPEYCLSHLLNSPGNFTASKLAWVKEHEPQIYEQIYKLMLPGDYIAMRLTGEINTTIGDLSEGIFWDFREHCVNQRLLDYFGFSREMIPDIVPTFSIQGRVSAAAAVDLGLAEGTPVSYRAGDQPNNALSLGVLNPGEVASTAGTSGVIYGVIGQVNYDRLSRVNTFAHVNHSLLQPRLGVLCCINGTGILNSWMRRNVMPQGMSYVEMNELAAQAPIGAEGVSIIPFGNGAERILRNSEVGASILGINFNIHNRSHLLRAAQEGIVFSFIYGMEIMQEMGMSLATIKAGLANMFLSPIFRDTLAGTTGTVIELYDTDGAAGAAKGAGIGAGVYATPEEAFASLQKKAVVEPNAANADAYREAYFRWRERLN
jgi:xylulokinase